MFKDKEYIPLNFDYNSFTEEELNKVHAIVYHIEYNPRSCTHYSANEQFICDKNGDGFANTRVCREALKFNGIYSGKYYDYTVKIIVKKLRDLVPLMKGEIKLKALIQPKYYLMRIKYLPD